MLKVTSIGYHDTGSSVVIDYLKEFKHTVFPEREVECRFLEDPDGISDLEYNLVDNWNRLNNGFAIKRYERFVEQYNHHYSLLFGKNWRRCSKEFIDGLIDYSYPGYWHCDLRLLPYNSKLIYYCRRAINKLRPIKRQKTPDYNYFPHIYSYYSHPDKSKFYTFVQDYCNNLINSLSKEQDCIMILDQCIPTTNISRYLNYIDDLKVVLVDRDPRDVYIEEQHIDDHVLPTDPFIFASMYKDMRWSQKQEISNKNVLFIRFEDMIYKYDQTTQKIRDFLGLNESDHIYPLKYFDPNKSIKNTKLWTKFAEHTNAIELFDTTLHDYYYNY